VPKARAHQVITYRIELQGKERELAEQALAAYTLGRAGNALEGLGVPELVKMMDDPTKIVQVLYSLATVYEAIFGPDSTRWPTVFDAASWWDEYQAKSNRMAAMREDCDGDVGVIGQILDSLRVLFGASDEVLRSRWDCDPEETVTTDSTTPPPPPASDTEEEQEWPHSGGGGGGGPFGSPI